MVVGYLRAWKADAAACLEDLTGGNEVILVNLTIFGNPTRCSFERVSTHRKAS
jgi:hypothetical protein